MKTKPVNIIKQFFCYLLGLVIIAVGINIAKLSALGISPVSSIPRAVEVIWGFSLGNATQIVYCVLIVLQIIVLRKKFKPVNLLGIVVAIGFGFIVDFFGVNPAKPGHLLAFMPKPESYIMKLVYILSSLVIIAIGVFMYLRPKWVPMPAEGLAGAISQITKKPFGDCKTAVDTSMIATALILQLIFMGGIHSFARDDVVVREGTILSAVCIGQIVKLLTRFLAKPFDKFLGK